MDIILVCGATTYELSADAGLAVLRYSEKGSCTYDGDSATFSPDTCLVNGMTYGACEPQTVDVVNDTST